MELSVYDFDIVYKHGKLNTNADALSRITIDSEILKSMIPSTDIKVVTRSNTRKQGNSIIRGIENDDHLVKSGHLYSWESTYISDIKGVKSLKFSDIINRNKEVVPHIQLVKTEL